MYVVVQFYPSISTVLMRPRGPKQYRLQLAIHICSFTDWLVLRKLKKKKILVVYLISSVSDMLLKMDAEAKSRGNTVMH